MLAGEKKNMQGDKGEIKENEKWRAKEKRIYTKSSKTKQTGEKDAIKTHM